MKFLITLAAMLVMATMSLAQTSNPSVAHGTKWEYKNVRITVTIDVNEIRNEATVTFTDTSGSSHNRGTGTGVPGAGKSCTSSEQIHTKYQTLRIRNGRVEIKNELGNFTRMSPPKKKK